LTKPWLKQMTKLKLNIMTKSKNEA
jgi:hypothetical protein